MNDVEARLQLFLALKKELIRDMERLKGRPNSECLVKRIEEALGVR